MYWKIFTIAGGIANRFSLTAFAIAGVLYIVSKYFVSKRTGKFPTSPLLAIVTLVLFALIAGAYQGWMNYQQSVASIYRVRVTVIDPRGMPVVEDVQLTSTFGGEQKDTPGGWEFDIPAGSVPSDGRLTIYALRQSSYLSGKQEVILAGEHNPAITISLTKDTFALVRGIVVDRSGQALLGAQVSVVGYGAEQTTTQAGGSFVLPAHAAIGEAVQLHVEKTGFSPVEQWHQAGEEPASIVLDRK